MICSAVAEILFCLNHERNANIDILLALAHAGGQKVVYENATDEEKKGYNLMSNSSLDAAKLEKLGWRACFDLEEGAEATVKYMKKLRG